MADSSSLRTRHGLTERTSMRDLMVHEGQTHEHQQPITNATRTLNDPATTGWRLPRRARAQEHYHQAREREGLSKGFAAFYGDSDAAAAGRDGHVTERQTKLVGDTARRHFEQKPSEEQQWKRGFKPTLPEILPARPRGKKPVAAVDTRPPFEETSDIPRGKKSVRTAMDPPLSGFSSTVDVETNNSLVLGSSHAPRASAANSSGVGPSSSSSGGAGSADATAMGRKKVVLDPVRNVPVAWKGPPFFAPTEADETLFEGLRNRTVQRTEEQKRNGIPCKVPGDLPYKSVEQAPGYVQSINPRNAKCGYEKPTQPFVFRDTFAAKESSMRRTQEISDVRSLPNY